MEPEGLLPHLQVPATCPYPDPARSSPYPQIPLPEDPPIYAWVSQAASLYQVSPTKQCIRLSSPPTNYFITHLFINMYRNLCMWVFVYVGVCMYGYISIFSILSPAMPIKNLLLM